MAVNRNTLTNKVLGDGSFDNGSFVSKGLAVNPKTGKDFTSDTSTPASMKYNPTEAKKNYGRKASKKPAFPIRISRC